MEIALFSKHRYCRYKYKHFATKTVFLSTPCFLYPGWKISRTLTSNEVPSNSQHQRSGCELQQSAKNILKEFGTVPCCVFYVHLPKDY